MHSQEDVDEFGAMCYSQINGTLFIGTTLNNDINSLLPLSSINKIISEPDWEYSLRIMGTQLESLEGIDLTNSIKGLVIYFNDNLVNLDDINIGDSMIYLGISNNENLVSLTGLEELVNVEGLIVISQNNSLESLNGLNNLQHTGGLNIKYKDFKLFWFRKFDYS